MSPSTRPCRIRKSRASSGLMRPHCTVRSCTIGRPYSSTFALATAEPREPDQCGSAYVVRVECAGQRLGPRGIDRPREYRAHRRAGLHQFGAHHPLRCRSWPRRRRGTGRNACRARPDSRSSPSSARVSSHGRVPHPSAQRNRRPSARAPPACPSSTAGRRASTCGCRARPTSSTANALPAGSSGSWRISRPWAGGGQRVADLELQLLAHLAQLGDQILPLAHAQPAEVLGLADAAQRVVARLAICLEHAVPDVQRGQEVAGRVRIPVVDAVRLLTVLVRDVRADPAGSGTPRPPAPRPECSAWSTSRPR